MICEVSTKYGFLVLLTTLDLLIEQKKVEGIILLVSEHSVDPEISNGLYNYIFNQEISKKYFKKILNLNKILSPLHPSKWEPPGEKNKILLYSYRSIFLSLFGVDNVKYLLFESIQVPPARTLAKIFLNADLYVYSDGLMTYGPTRIFLPNNVGVRIKCVFYVDLIENLEINYLKEYCCNSVRIDSKKIFNKVKEISKNRNKFCYEDGAVFLGQYLSGLGLLSEQEEVDLYSDALELCAKKSKCKHVYFKPHPSFNNALSYKIDQKLSSNNINLTILDGDKLIEEILLTFTPRFLCSVFSTGLATASSIFGIKSYSYKTRYFLKKLYPYQNSNRVPAYIVLRCFEDLEGNEYTYNLCNLQSAIDILSASMHLKMLVKSSNDLNSLKAKVNNKIKNDLFLKDAQKLINSYIVEVD